MRLRTASAAAANDRSSKGAPRLHLQTVGEEHSQADTDETADAAGSEEPEDAEVCCHIV